MDGLGRDLDWRGRENLARGITAETSISRWSKCSCINLKGERHQTIH
jgi:hypothetical protein